MNIQLSQDELTAKALAEETLETVVEQVNTNGYVVIENVVDKAKIDEIRTAFDVLFQEYIGKKGCNTGTNRAQMMLPFMRPYIDEDIIANPIILSIVDPILGANCRCSYFASDTPMPGSDYQLVHADAFPLFNGFTAALPCYNLVLNIPLVDTTEENGPLEIWPGGTHLLPDHKVHSTFRSYRNEHIDMVRAAKYMTSEKVLMPAGSIVIRDVRTWHRGTPNRSGRSRTNLALVYSKHWYGLHADIQIPQDTYDSLSERARQLFRFEKIGCPVKWPY